MKYYDGLDDKGRTLMSGLVSLKFLSYIGKIYVMLESTQMKTDGRERESLHGWKEALCIIIGSATSP